MAKPKDLGHLAHIVAYDTENHITVPAGITMHTNQLVASQAWVTTELGSYALSTSLGSYVPTSRTITINGTTYDLSDNRSWDITSMIYPDAGIPLSTGSAWGSSITNNSDNWNTAYGWGNHASAGYLTGITSTLVTNALGYTPVTNARTITINGTSFDLSANREWTIATSDSTKMPLSGGVFTGLVTFNFNNTDTVEWPRIRFGASATGWDEGIIKASSTEGVFGRYGMGIHFDSARAFGIYSSSWTKVMGFKSDEVRSFVNMTVNGNTVLHAGNYNSYSPTLTGGGASGTWGINITGQSHGIDNNGNAISGMGPISTWDSRPGVGMAGFGINWHTGVSISGYGGYGGVRLYSSGYPTHSGSVLRLEASGAVYTYGGLYSDGNLVLNASNASYAYNMNQNVRTTDSPTFRSIFSSEGYSAVAYGYNNNGGFAMNNAGQYWGIMYNYGTNDWRLGWGSQTAQVGWNLRWDNGGNIYVNGTMNASNLSIGDGNVELYKSQTIDMSGGAYSTSNYYPVIIGVPTSGVTIQIQNNLNSNVPSWSTHPGGFSINLTWTTNGSGWGTTAVNRSILQWQERFTSVTICGGITQLGTSSQEIVWLRGGGVYYFIFSRNVSGFPSSTNYTNPYNTESANVSSTVVNSPWNVSTGRMSYGEVYSSGDVIAYSDIRSKGNIRPINHALEKVLKSNGVLYDRLDNDSKNNIGFIAQELEREIPELVYTDNDGFKSVKYQNMTAILTEAIKEQQKQIEELKNKLDGITK